jgi:hypothetical protein
MQTARVELNARRDLFSAAKMRLGFCFSGQEFKKRLSDLTEHNNTLQSILAQVQRMHNTTTQVTLSSAPLRATQSSRTRTAAMRVYNCLQLACRAHNGHFVYLSLEDLQTQSRNDPLSVGVDVGLQPTTHELGIKPLVRFVVGSMLSSRERHPTGVPFVREDEQYTTEQPKPTSKRKRKPDPLPVDGQENKKLKYEGNVKETGLPELEERSLLDIQWLHLGQGVSARSSQESRISLDLAENGDFCKQIRRYPQNLPQLYELGGLNIRLYPELRVYSPREPTSCQSPLSLLDLFLKRPKVNYGVGLLPHEIFYLAKRAALTLLHFHTTSLLTPDWSGGDIVFFEREKGNWYLQPYLKVNTKPSDPIPPRTNADSRCIRNPYTFSLGCLLIELAHQSPLSDLQEPDDIVDGEGGPETRFNISSRVSKSMVIALGTPYTALVRKCIYCDFGEDDNMTKPALQAAFEKHVISVLEKLERKYWD